MVFCEACPIKKMVPLDRIQTASHCFGGDFQNCALFAEIAARVNPAPSKRPTAQEERRQQKRQHDDPGVVP